MIRHHRRFSPGLVRDALDQLDLGLGVRREAVDSHDHRDTELARDPDVVRQVFCARPKQFEILAGVGFVQGRTRRHFRTTAVHLQGADGRYQHDGIGHQPGIAALDVEEFLHADVGTEPALGPDIVAQLQRDLVGQNAAVAVRDVRERPGVDEGGLAFERLHQVRHDRVLEQHGNRPSHAQVLQRHRLAGLVQTDHRPAHTLAEIFKAGRQRENRHQLAGNRDIVPGAAWENRTG